MNRFVSFFKNLRLARVITVLFVGVTLLLTACNTGNLQGARPNNPPVQMGGNNNPHSQGGDGYTNYKMSTDPKVNRAPSKLRSDAAIGISVASAEIESDSAELLYPGLNTRRSENPDIGTKPEALQPEDYPAKRQEVIDRSNPDEKILEKVGQQFKDASEFIKDGLDTTNRPEASR